MRIAIRISPILSVVPLPPLRLSISLSLSYPSPPISRYLA